MRPYTRLLVCISLGAIVSIMACANKNSSGAFIVGTSSTDLGNGNTSTQQTGTTFNQNGGGAEAVLAGTGTPTEIKTQAVIGGTGGTRGGPSGVFPGSMLAIAAAGFLDGVQRGTALQGPASATLSAGQLISYSLDRTGEKISLMGLPTSFSDGTITWGRWSYNPYQVTQAQSFYASNIPGNGGPVTGGGLHYVVGAPTPVANLPASGTATYNLLGTTFPTLRSTNASDQDSNRFLSGSLAVLWGGATTKIGVDFTVSVAPGGVTTLFNAVSNGGLANPAASQLGLIPGTSSFSGAINATPSDPGACNFLNATTCKTDVSGFFVGNNAERAGLTYAIHTNGTSGFGDISGAATFTKGASAPGGPTPGAPTSVVTPLTQTTPVNISFAGGPAFPPFIVASNGSVTQNADSSLSAFTASPGVASFTRGTTASSEVGSDSIITWGRWTSGTPGGNLFGSPPTALANNQALHYIAGVPTSPSALPASGTATFNLLGATSPTFGNGIGGPGSVTAGTLAVAWGGSATTKIGMDMTVLMPGDSSYRILTAGGLATPGSSQVTINAGSSLFSGNVPMPTAGRACAAGGCTANIGGFFAGAAAERAGVAYGISDGTLSGGIPINGIFGAAAFKR